MGRYDINTPKRILVVSNNVFYEHPARLPVVIEDSVIMVRTE